MACALLHVAWMQSYLLQQAYTTQSMQKKAIEIIIVHLPSASTNDCRVALKLKTRCCEMGPKTAPKCTAEALHLHCSTLRYTPKELCTDLCSRRSISALRVELDAGLRCTCSRCAQTAPASPLSCMQSHFDDCFLKGLFSHRTQTQAFIRGIPATAPCFRHHDVLIEHYCYPL